LLEPEYLVPPNDPDSLAAKILDLTGQPRAMEAASARNLEKAREYGEEVLTKRRLAFYSHVRQTTAEWMKAGTRRTLPLPGLRPLG